MTSSHRIYLLGFMGSGKSRIGTLLAQQIQSQFVDLDKEIERHSGKSISQIFNEEGEEQFRELETRLLQQLSKQPDRVIATGGGTPCHSNNISLIRKTGTSVYLQVGIDTLYKRLNNEPTHRPLIASLQKEELYSFIQNTLKKRAPYYKQAQHIVNGEHSPQQVVRQILTRLYNS